MLGVKKIRSVISKQLDKRALPVVRDIVIKNTGADMIRYNTEIELSAQTGKGGIGFPIDMLDISQFPSWAGDKYPGAVSYSVIPSMLDHTALRGRSRNARWDSTQAASIKKRLEDNVVNVGLTLESSPVWDICAPDWDEERRDMWTKITEARWHLFCKDKKCSYNEKFNMYQMQRNFFKHRFIDGEFFGVIRYLPDPARLNPLSIQFIDPEQVYSGMLNQSDIKAAEARGNKIEDGIEFDSRGREIAYYIWNRYNDGYTRVPKRGPRSGRLFVLHSFDEEKIGQNRGFPELSGVIHELQKISDFTVFELQAAVINSLFAAWIEPSQDRPVSGGFEALGGSLKKEYQPIADETKVSEPTKMEWKYPGILMDTLGAGEKLHSYDTKRPNVSLEAFIKSVMKYLSGSIGVPIEAVELLFGQNYSASRAALVLFWNNVLVRRSCLEDDFLNELYEMWMLGEVGAGNIEAPNFNIPYARKAWLNSSWVGIPKPSIDPFKEAKAREVVLKNGLSTREKESREYNGSSFDNNITRIKNENSKLAEALNPLAGLKVG